MISVMSPVKSVLRSLIPFPVRRNFISVSSLLVNAYSERSFSQEGEDLLLRRFFEKQTTGFYVDIGAHHPKLYSNTYFFYRRGWRGINVDATPGSMKPFRVFRPRDINLEVAVSSRTEPITLTTFNEPALNSFNVGEFDRRGSLEYAECRKVELRPRTLASLLEEYLEEGQQVDFLSIDVEGEDLNVLKSNDWGKFKPKIVLVEDRKFTLENPQGSPIFNFMKLKNYALKAKTLNTLLFQYSSPTLTR